MIRNLQKKLLSHTFLPNPTSFHYKPPSLIPIINRAFCNIPSSKPPIHPFYKFLLSDSSHREISEQIFNLLAYGEMYVDVLDFQKARRKYSEALQLSESTFGSDKIITALSLHRLGDLTQIEGGFEKSLEYYTSAMQTFAKHLNGNSPLIAGLNRSIGLLYKHVGEHSKAVNHLVKATECWANLEEYEKASVSMKFVIEMVEKGEITGLEEKMRIYEAAGDIYTQMRDVEKAKGYLEEVKEMKFKKYKEKDPNMGSLYMLLGFVKFQENDLDAAADYLVKGIKLYQKVKEKNMVMKGRAYATLGYIQEKYENYKKALEYYSSSHQLFIQVAGEEGDIKIAKALGYMGNAYFNLNEKEEALVCFEKSAKIVEKGSIKDQEFIRTLYNNLGTLYQRLEEDKLAIECFEKALKLREGIEEEENMIEVASIRRKLGIAYVNLHRLDDAKECFEKARSIYDKDGRKFRSETSYIEVLKEELEKRRKNLQRLEISI